MDLKKLLLLLLKMENQIIKKLWIALKFLILYNEIQERS